MFGDKIRYYNSNSSAVLSVRFVIQTIISVLLCSCSHNRARLLRHVIIIMHANDYRDEFSEGSFVTVH